MEKKVFSLPEVSGELAKTVEAWIHYDDDKKGDANTQLQKKYAGVTTAPYYMVLDASTDEVFGRWGDGATDAETFRRWLTGSFAANGGR